MPTHDDSHKIYQKVSEENHPLPQTTIKGYLSIPLRTSEKRQLKEIIFLVPSLRDCTLGDSKRPRINHQSDR